MKYRNKYLALFLCFIMILNLPNTVFAANNITVSENLQTYSVLHAGSNERP